MKRIKLGEILTESKIESSNPDPDRRITVKLFLKGIEKRPYEAGVEGGTKYYTRKAGQFIYGKQNLFKGAFGIIPPELDGFDSSLDIPAFDVNKDCLPEWLFYYFKQGNYYETLEAIATGTGSRRIQPSRLYEIEIPLPSITEQRRVIEHAKKIETKFDLLHTELNHQSTLITQLRQSILQEAVQGKLVPQNPKDEPATVLLEKIKKEKAKLIAEGKLKKEKELAPINKEEIPFELPKGWVWCRYSDVAELKHGYQFREHDFVAEGIPVIKISQCKNDGTLDLSKCDFIDKKRLVEFDDIRIYKGDLLMALTGGTLGKVTRVRNNYGDIVQNYRVGKFVAKDEYLLLDYLEVVLKSELFQTLVKERINQNAQPNVGKEDIERILIPLPPKNIQKNIVKKVEQLMNTCNALEKEVECQKEKVKALMQALLREAFEGGISKSEKNSANKTSGEESEMLIAAEQKQAYKKPKRNAPIS